MYIVNPSLDELSKDILKNKYVGFDTETNGLNTRTADCLMFSYKTKEHKYAVDCSLYSDEDLSRFFDSVKEVYHIAHNAPYDTGIIFSNYNVMLEKVICTMIIAMCFDRGVFSPAGYYGLIGVLKRYLNIDLIDTADKHYWQMTFVNGKKGMKVSYGQLDYGAGDVEYLPMLWEKYQQLIKATPSFKGVIQLECDVIPAFVKMQHDGAFIDTQKWQAMIDDWGIKLHEVELKLDGMIKDLSKTYATLRGGKFTRTRHYVQLTQSSFDGEGNILVANENLGNVNYSSEKAIEDIFLRLKLPLPYARDKKKDSDKVNDANKKRKVTTDPNQTSLFDSYVSVVDIKRDVPEGMKVSFSKDALNNYLQEYPDTPLDEFVLSLHEHRRLSKLIGVYGESIIKQADEDSKIYTFFRQYGTQTGRCTSSKLTKGSDEGFNALNIPSKGPGGKIKECFVAPPGFRALTSDLGSAELVIAASKSKDKLLLSSINDGVDLHSTMATVMFSEIYQREFNVNKSEDEVELKCDVVTSKGSIGSRTFKVVPNDLRSASKGVTFALIYLASAPTVYDSLAKYINPLYKGEERMACAKRIHKQLEQTLSGLIAYLKAQADKANKQGYLIANKTGRIRRFPKGTYNSAANYSIQATNGDIIKHVLIDIYKLSKKIPNSIYIHMSIYDEIFVSVREDLADEYAEIIQGYMVKWFNYYIDGVEGTASMKIKDHWEK